tara:strand:- start:2451 stop:3233 length:783 start_codon:yes stop_codon:yes gene_type:complete
MKRLIYQVYTGKRSELYDHCTQSVKEYADRIGAHYLIQREPILCIAPDIFTTNRSRESYEKYGGFLPIYEKENAFAYLDSYDQIAIIDADIFIRPDCDECVFSASGTDCDFAGVIERTMAITPEYQAKINNYSRMQYAHNSISELFDWNDLGADFYNMGMMIVNKSISKYLRGQTPEQFIRRPEFKNFVDGMGPWKWSTDQTLLNYWVKKEKMTVNNLDWKWNGLFTANTNIKECNFVHFFLKDKLPNRGENVKDLMSMI